MNATYTKLKSGEWGIRVNGSVREGESVTVRKKSGETKVEVVKKVVWSGNGVSLCAVSSSQPSSKTKSSRGRRTGCACGSIEGEYHDWYCASCRFDELDM